MYVSILLSRVVSNQSFVAFAKYDTIMVWISAKRKSQKAFRFLAFFIRHRGLHYLVRYLSKQKQAKFLNFSTFNPRAKATWVSCDDTYDCLSSSSVSSDSISAITRLITGTVFLFSAISCLITGTSFFGVVHINLTSDAIRVITIDSVHHVDDFT